MATSASTGSSNLTSSNGWNIIEAVNTSGTSNVTTVYSSGISNASNTSTLSSVPTTFSNTLYVNGRAGTNSNSVAGNFGELLVFSNALTDAQRQQVEGYLASKWGSNVSSGPSITPTSISGCQIWLDASDTSTYVLNGANLTQLKDKSGNAYHFSQSGGYSNATVQSNYANGLNAWNFSGSNKYCSPTSSGCYPLDCYIVIASKALARTDFIAVGDTGSGDFNSLTFSEYTSLRWHNGSGGFGRTPSTVSPTNETSTGLLLMNWSLSNSNFIIRRNGSLLSQTSSYTYSMPSSSIFQLGYRAPWSSYPNPDIACEAYFAEVVVFNSQLSTTSRQQIEGYLAWKWGLQANLPSGHPYASTLTPTHPFCSVRPFTRAFQPIDIPGCQLWLDATDLSKLTFSSGTSNVTVWGDKANGSNATANTPIAYASNGLGTGYPALTFTGSQWLLGNTSVTGTGLTIFSVFNMSNSSAGIVGRIVALAATGANDYNTTSYVFVGRKNGVTAVGPYRNGTAPAATVSYSTPTLNTTYFDGTNAYTSTNGGTPVTAASSGSFAVTAYAIGNNTNTGDVPNGPFNGYISEILVYNATLTASQRQQVEGYLAWKWGLSSSLPTTQSFKLFPPLTVSFSPLQIQGCQLWLDAMDTTTIAGSLSSITAWNDKSGVSNNMTSGSGSGVTNSSWTTNSVYLNGSSYFSNTIATSVYTVFFAYNQPSTAAGGPLFTRTATTDATGFFPNNNNSSYYLARSDTTWASTTSTIANNVINLVCVQYDGSSNINVWVNGTNYITSTTVAAPTVNGFWLGYRPIATYKQFMTCYVNEVVYYSNAVTTSQRQQVEGYLASKWGVKSSLPATHPYKVITP